MKTNEDASRGAFVKNVLRSVAVAAAILPMAVRAATTYYVATYGDDGNAGTSWDCPFKTIEKGVATVKTGSGEKELIISNGTYVLTQTIEWPTSGTVAMRSLTGDPKDVILDADGQFPIAYYNGGAGSSFRGLTFINGKTSASYTSSNVGGLHLRAQVNMTDCIISNCVTTADGALSGGLYYVGYGSELRNVTILNCSAPRQAGGAYIGSYGGAPTINGMVVSNCMLVGTSTGNRIGAGLYLAGANSAAERIQASNVVIGNCHVLNYSDKNVSGAGLYAAKSDCRNFTISDCSIVDNELTTIPTTVFYGGGAYLNDASLYDSVVTNCVLSRQNNTVNGKANGELGGGVYALWNDGVAEEWRTIISNCVIACCAATNDYNGIGQGGGIYLTASQAGGPLLCDSLITGNRAGQYGAGAFVPQNKKATIVRCEFSENAIDPKSYLTADVAGGGTAIASLGTVDIAGCRIKDNRGTVPGSYQLHNSAVRLQGSAATMMDCDLDGNYGYQYGAALSLRSLSGMVVSNCVFRGNSCEGQGGVLYTDNMPAGDTLITDCYITGNASTANCLIKCYPKANGAANIRLRNSLVSDNDCSSVLYYISAKTDTAVQMTVENCTVVSNRCSSTVFTREYNENAACMAFTGSVILFNKNASVFANYLTNVTYCCSSQFQSPVDASNIYYDSSKPLFVDLENGDLRPAKGSQLRDVVPAAAWMGDGSKKSTRDMGSGFEVASVGMYGITVNRVNAVPRLYGIAADIGCCEYQGQSGFILFVR